MIHKSNSNLFRGIASIFVFALAALSACSNETTSITSPVDTISPASAESASVISAAAGQETSQERSQGAAALPQSQVTLIDNTIIDNTISAADSNLSESEETALLYMREEEKLAHDLYLTLYEQWGLSLFQNIASSE